MIFITETCPKCGHNIQNLFTLTYPSFPQNECFNCGWDKNREVTQKNKTKKHK